MIDNIKTKDRYNFILLMLFILNEAGFVFLTFNSIIRYLTAIFICIGFLIVNTKKLKINKKLVFVFVIFLLLLTLSFIRNIEQYTVYINVLFSFCVAVIVVSCLDFNYFIKLFVKCMYIIAIFSLLIYFSNIILFKYYPSLLNFWPFKVTNSAKTLVNNYFLSVFQLSYRGYDRNFGPFWEPGAYQTFLNLALYFTIFLQKPFNKKYFIVFIITIFTTLSTTGVIALIVTLCVAFYHFSKNKKDNNNKKIKNILSFLPLIFAVTIIFFALIPNKFSDLVFGKLSGIFSGNYVSGSTYVRVAAFLEPLKVMINKSILGIGYKGLRAHAIEVGYRLNTCTFTNWFGMYGLGIGLLLNYFYASFVWLKRFDLITKIGLMIMIFIIIFSEDYSSNDFIYTLICYSIIYRSTQKEKYYGKEIINENIMAM